jgi:hypothetical protein
MVLLILANASGYEWIKFEDRWMYICENQTGDFSRMIGSVAKIDQCGYTITDIHYVGPYYHITAKKLCYNNTELLDSLRAELLDPAKITYRVG